MRQAGEPSVGEILQSIKQVIARQDFSQAGTHDRVAAPSARIAAANGEAGEVLELTEDLEHAPGAEGDPPVAQPEPALLAPNRAEGVRATLDAFAQLAAPGAAAPILRSGEDAAEALTRELLRPMLAEWLDKNLPPIVERLVTAELARIARHRD